MKKTILAAALAALAQPAAANDWQFEVTPYLFASGLDGDVKVGRLSATGVETTFRDLTKMLDFGFMGMLEGRKGNHGFLVDAVAMKVSENGETPGGAFGTVNGTMTQQVYSIAGTWRPGEAPFDLVAGLRYMRIKADLEIDSGALRGRRANDAASFTDAYVGARLQLPMADRWTFVAYGDVGAGGSDLSYQAGAGVAYAPSKDLTWKLGYRFLSVDYRKNEFVYDMDYAGPYLGVGFRF